MRHLQNLRHQNQNQEHQPMKRVGILAGTFDPVHEGHVAFARQAAKQCGLDKVYLLVEPRPRRKQGVHALEHRLEMVNLAIQHQPKLGSIQLQQARFTILETLPTLEALFAGAKLYMLLGEDVLGHLAHWPQIEKLAASCHFIIGLRLQDEKTVKRSIATVEQTRSLKIHYHLMKTDFNDHASSKIRLQIRRGQKPVGLPPAVAHYIQQHGLYAPAASAESADKS